MPRHWQDHTVYALIGADLLSGIVAARWSIELYPSLLPLPVLPSPHRRVSKSDLLGLGHSFTLDALPA